jgi:exopolyphosphatase/pppGpp-phosphohydrolase
LEENDDLKKDFPAWRLQVTALLEEHPEFLKLTNQPQQKNRVLLFAGGTFWKSMHLLQASVPGPKEEVISEEQIHFFSKLMQGKQFADLEQIINPVLEKLAGFKKINLETFMIAFVVIERLYEKLKPQKMYVTEEAARGGVIDEMITKKQGS